MIISRCADGDDRRADIHSALSTAVEGSSERKAHVGRGWGDGCTISFLLARWVTRMKSDQVQKRQAGMAWSCRLVLMVTTRLISA